MLLFSSRFACCWRNSIVNRINIICFQIFGSCNKALIGRLKMYINQTEKINASKIQLFEPTKQKTKYEAFRHSKKIDEELLKERNEAETLKQMSSMLLLLGPGDSGIQI